MGACLNENSPKTNFPVSKGGKKSESVKYQ